MKSRIYSTDLDNMTHDQIATSTHRMAKANDLPELLELSESLRRAVDDERDSAGIVDQIRALLIQ